MIMEFKIKGTRYHQYYFPKELHSIFRERLILIPDGVAAIIYPEGVPLDLVIDSTRNILKKLEMKKSLQG